MKSSSLKTLGFVVMLLLTTSISSLVSAQPGRGQYRAEGRPGNPGRIEKIKLTDDQQKKMDELRMQFREETGKMKDLINEKQAHLKTLINTDNRDMKDLDKTVDELTHMKGDLIKKGIAHRDAVKKILTQEQMMIWDKKAKQLLRDNGPRPKYKGMRGNNRPMPNRMRN